MSDTPKPATPLPWHREFGEREYVRGTNQQPVFGGHYTGHESKWGGRKPQGHVTQDMEYIVHACNSLPALEARVKELETALEWYGEQARLCRLIHSEGDTGRHNLSNDGGRKASASLSKEACDE